MGKELFDPTNSSEYYNGIYNTIGPYDSLLSLEFGGSNFACCNSDCKKEFAVSPLSLMDESWGKDYFENQ